MAGEHQRHHLVADLAVGEALAVLAAGGDEQAEDVAAAGVGGGAAAADLLVDDPVEDGARGHQPAPRRAGAAQQAQGEVDAEEAERRLEVVSPRRRPCRRRRGRGRAAPASRSASPGCASRRRCRRRCRGAGSASAASASIAHRRGRGLDLLAVEGGQHDRPGAVVVALVDRQEAVAEQRDQVAEARLAPMEVLRVADGDEVVGLRAEHEDDLGVEQAHAEDRPELFVGAEQQRQRVGGGLLGAREAEVTRPGRVGAPPPPLGAQVVGDAEERVRRQPRRAVGERRRRVDRGHGAKLNGKTGWLASQSPGEFAVICNCCG